MAEGQKPSNHDFAPSAPIWPNSESGSAPTILNNNTNTATLECTSAKPVLKQNVHATSDQAEGSFNNTASEHNLPMNYDRSNETVNLKTVYDQPPPAYDEKMAASAPTAPPSPPPEQIGKFLSLPAFVESQESDNDIRTEDFADQTSDVKSCFLRKLYGIVFLQMIVITAVNAAIFNDATTSTVMMKGLKFFLPLGIMIYIVTCICVHVCDGPQRRVPGNLICFAMFTVSLLLMLGLGTASSKGPEMFVAMANIILTLMALMVCAFNNKYAMWSGFALCTVMSLITYGIAYVLGIYAGKDLLFCSYIGAMPFCCVLAHTGHSIVNNKHHYNITTRESIFAASVIYVDVWNFFFFKKRSLRFTW